MFGSLPIGRIAGIAIRVRWTLIALIAYLVVLARGAPGPLLTLVGSLLVAVLLHELGHALMAKRMGVRVLDITFGPLGGSANLVDMPDRPRVEGWIAAAGPLVNLALAGAALLFYAASAAYVHANAAGLAATRLELELLANPAKAMSGLQLAWASGLEPLESARLFALGFWAINLYLGGFNLLPAFPLDGGRILRAALATRQGWLAATESVVRVSRWLVLVGLMALLVAQPSLWCLSLVTAGFLWFHGMRELLVVRLRYGGNGVFSFARGFSFGGANPFAAPQAEPGQAEVLSVEAAEEASAARAEATADDDPEPPRGQARRPRVWDGRHGTRGASGAGEWVDDLENFRGRLRREDERDV